MTKNRVAEFAITPLLPRFPSAKGLFRFRLRFYGKRRQKEFHMSFDDGMKMLGVLQHFQKEYSLSPFVMPRRPKK